jgi:hypothetical protein
MEREELKWEITLKTPVKREAAKRLVYNLLKNDIKKIGLKNILENMSFIIKKIDNTVERIILLFKNRQRKNSPKNLKIKFVY